MTGVQTCALPISWFVSLAVILVLNAAIAAAYYLRLIAAMYFKSTKKGVQADGGLAAGVGMLVCLVLVLLVTLQPRRLFTPATRAGAAAANVLTADAESGTRSPSDRHVAASP